MTCKLIAHRGASAEAPENTLAAFRRALEIGVDGIELDVYVSRDGVPVVVHDPELPGLGKVEELSLADIRKFDAGGWFDRRFAGEKIPTLDEVLKLPLGKTFLMIELKGKPLKQSVAPHYTASFHLKADIAIASRYEELTYFPGIVALGADLISQDLVATIHNKGQKLFVWTVDSKKIAHRLRALGVDAIITNDPAALK